MGFCSLSKEEWQKMKKFECQICGKVEDHLFAVKYKNYNLLCEECLLKAYSESKKENKK